MFALMIPKNQHTIPRLHLQHFAGREPMGQVWTYDATEDRQWSAVPEETCVQKHFYSAERDDGSIDARLEIFLSEVEGRAAPVYEGLLEGRLPRKAALILPSSWRCSTLARQRCGGCSLKLPGE